MPSRPSLPMFQPRLLLILILAVAPLLTAWTSASEHSELGAPRPELTPQVVWNHSEAIYQQCDIPDFACVLQLMQKMGASPEAQEFVRKQEAWVIEFTEYGNTDLLLLETFRANTNQYYALASRVAGVIAAEGYDLSPQDQQRRDVIAVLSRHPQAFFIAKPSFLRHEPGSNGGSRFVFSDAVAECRACEPLATGKLIYEFDKDGRFLGGKVRRFYPDALSLFLVLTAGHKIRT